jgi:hypothetical protein
MRHTATRTGAAGPRDDCLSARQGAVERAGLVEDCDQVAQLGRPGVRSEVAVLGGQALERIEEV